MHIHKVNQIGLFVNLLGYGISTLMTFSKLFGEGREFRREDFGVIDEQTGICLEVGMRVWVRLVAIDWILGEDVSPSPTSAVGRVVIRHDPGAPSDLGENAGGDLGGFGDPHLFGIDNITATVIPEPSRGVLFLVSALCAAIPRRRRRRRR